jgi:predicted phosphodiesterase
MSEPSTDMLMGLLFVGDPHLASRVPGFRKDDYPRTILAKLRWAVDYAASERLLPILLGDLFDFPRDNANWMLVELLALFAGCPGGCASGIFGNHDCKENELGINDTLSVLVTAGHVRLLDRSPWRGRINGCQVIVGGTSWNQQLPEAFERSPLPPGEPVRVFWVTHHDLRFPGYEEQAHMGCRAIEGIDVVVNGHIHRALGEVIAGNTTWLNPGNITRVTRGEATRRHAPSVLRIDIAPDGAWKRQRVPVPFLPFDEVFHAECESADVKIDDSMFVRELAALESARTAGGAGLRAFLDANLPQFGPRVSQEINALAQEVLNDGR